MDCYVLTNLVEDEKNGVSLQQRLQAISGEYGTRRILDQAADLCMVCGNQSSSVGPGLLL
jgi:hypothetical protein